MCKFLSVMFLCCAVCSCSALREPAAPSFSPDDGWPHLTKEQHNEIQNVIASIEKPSEIQEFTSSAELPSAMRSIIADENGRIADPGQEWQEGCVIKDPTLPFQRLLWAAEYHGLYFLHYESGTYTHSSYVAIARIDKSSGASQIEWALECRKNLQSFHDLVKALEFNDFCYVSESKS